MSVTFFSQFLGAFPKALSPMGAHPYSGARVMFVPLSSTKTSFSGSRSFTLSRQALLAFSSRSEAPSDLFFGSSPTCVWLETS
jgi:hypothetical protein